MTARPEVQAVVDLALSAADKIEGASGTFARQVISAARFAEEQLTPEILLRARRMLSGPSPAPAALPSNIVAQALVGSFAKLSAAASVLRQSAGIAAVTDSVPLANKVAATASSMLDHVGRVSAAFARVGALTSGSALGGFEVSDFMRGASYVLIALGFTTAGATAVPGAALLALASVVDEIDGAGSEAAELAAAACAEIARSTGHPCTPEQWSAFYTQNRTAEQQDSFDRIVSNSFGEVVKQAASVGFWVVLLGVAGTVLYFAWPTIASRAVAPLREEA